MGRKRAPSGPLTAVERQRFVLSHRGLAEAIAVRFVSDNHSCDQEEAKADALLGLVEAARLYRPGGTATFGLYAKRFIQGAVREGHFQRSGMRQVQSKGVRSYRQVYAFDPDADLDGISYDDYREVLMDVRAGLRELSPRYQALLLLAAAGFDPSEIAKGEGTTYEAAKQALWKARQQMRRVAA